MSTLTAHLSQPPFIIGQPRIQFVNAFHYLHLTHDHTQDGQPGTDMGSLIARARAALSQAVGPGARPPLVVMFFNVPSEPGTYKYDIQVGYAVNAGTNPPSGTRLRYVEPAYCASLLAWGDVGVYAKSYPPLLQYIDQCGLQPGWGWTEWTLYWEGDDSVNNIVWIQHAVEEKPGPTS